MSFDLALAIPFPLEGVVLHRVAKGVKLDVTLLSAGVQKLIERRFNQHE